MLKELLQDGRLSEGTDSDGRGHAPTDEPTHEPMDLDVNAGLALDSAQEGDGDQHAEEVRRQTPDSPMDEDSEYLPSGSEHGSNTHDAPVPSIPTIELTTQGMHDILFPSVGPRLR